MKAPVKDQALSRPQLKREDLGHGFQVVYLLGMQIFLQPGFQFPGATPIFVPLDGQHFSVLAEGL